MTRHHCPDPVIDGWGACHGTAIDFTEITRTTPPEVTDRARGLCAQCPLLIGCLRYLETADVAGFAGGMFEDQRKSWQQRHRYEVPQLNIADVSEANELRGALVDDVPATRGERTNGADWRLTPQVVDIVLRMTRAGFTAEEIVERLAMPRVTHRTIKYLRIRYKTSPPQGAMDDHSSRSAAQQRAG